MIRMLWTLIPAPYRLLAAGVSLMSLLALLGGLYLYVDHKGYARGKAAADAFWQREIALVENANKSAVANANKQLEEALAALATRNQELNHVLQDVDAAADAAPDAADVGLRADSLRRLNSVR